MNEQKKKVFIVSFTVPYPADDGGKIYVYGSIDYIRHYYEVTLLFVVGNKSQHDGIKQLKILWPEVQIEMVDNIIVPVVYQPTFTDKIIDFLKKIKRQARQEKKETGSQPLELYTAAKSNDFTLLDKKIANKVADILSANKFNIVQIEYTKFLSLVHLIPKDCFSIFVEIESRYLTFEDYSKVKSNNTSYIHYLIENTKELEFGYMKKYDLVLALSDEDLKRLSSALPEKRVLLSPYSVLDEHIRSAEEIKEFSPHKLIFMGSENHQPNVDAVEWFINSVLPEINKTTDIPFYITGKWSDSFKEKFRENSKVQFTGYLENLSAVLKNSIVVVPIRIGGGGLRAKVIQAMAFGLPIVSTTLGSEGIGLVNGYDVMVADSAPGFANAVTDIIFRKELAMVLIKNAHNFILAKYTKAVAGENRKRIYDECIGEK